MIGLVVLTHGQMAAECLRAAEMIIGPIAAARAVSIDRSWSVEEASSALDRALTEVDEGSGVLVLTDMFGGTPTNIAAGFLEERHIDILAGVNLPILIKAAGARLQMDLAPLTEFLRDYGRQAVLRPIDLLKARS